MNGLSRVLWSSHLIRKPSGQVDDWLVKEEVALAENFCRNPDKDKNGPWCITNAQQMIMEYCNVTKCSKFYFILKVE